MKQLQQCVFWITTVYQTLDLNIDPVDISCKRLFYFVKMCQDWLINKFSNETE
jgi:hypothetical protein